ncbi:MAG: DUF6125 family protein [Syntrophales bacterium LBB04]|nr:DUF6125 family protein [Syntrophales bacterium LBB04]
MIMPRELQKEEIVDLLNRCWMTHDGMWFYHCLKNFGIEKANELNKAAIKSLAPMEIDRIKKALGLEKQIENFQEFKDFFVAVSHLFIPAFMNITMTFPKENIVHWQFEPGNCFAYKGIKRIGVIDQYECGVIYRLECWFESLGIKYSVAPQVRRCLMLDSGVCQGDFYFDFR